MSVPAGILRHAASSRVAVFDQTGSATFADLALHAGRVATRLGAKLDGARVGILVEPNAQWVTTLLGVWLAGGVAVPLSPLYPAAELAWFCADADVETVVVSANFGALASELRAGRCLCDPADLIAPGVAGTERSTWRPEELAALVYTSGTTGKPKGVMLTHGGLATQTEVLAAHWGITADDRLLHVLPLHHVHGLVVSLLTALVAGASVRMLPRFDVTAVVEGLADASVWMAVPTMYQKLRTTPAVAARLAPVAARLRLAISGSAALPVATATWWESMTGAIPLERYGMTETGIVLSNPLPPAARRRGGVGAPLPTVEVRVVPDEPSEVAGDLHVRGPSLFAGYWQRAEATRTAYTSDGWFRTGDRAVQEADGTFRLLGRTSVDIIKSGGYKLSALEIEDVLRRHTAIDDVAVVGMPDEIWGERVVAVVTITTAVSAGSLRAWARGHLATYQVPKEFVILEALPRNPLGKVVKPELLAALSRPTRV